MEINGTNDESTLVTVFEAKLPDLLAFCIAVKTAFADGYCVSLEEELITVVLLEATSIVVFELIVGQEAL